MTFRDLDEFFHSSLELPIGGRTYSVPSADAATGLWAQRVFALAEKVRRGEKLDDHAGEIELDDAQERSLYERLLGPALAEMQANQVPWEQIKHAGKTALIWTAADRAAAERFWAQGDAPGEPPAPNRAARRAGSASRTRSRASTAGTTSSTTRA